MAGVLLTCEKPAFQRRAVCLKGDASQPRRSDSGESVYIDGTPLEGDLVIISEFKVHKPFSPSIP